MASKRRLRKRSCAGKVAYTDPDVAHRWAAVMRGRHLGADYHAYKCRFCKKYHVGRATNQQKTAKRIRQQ